MTQFLRDFCRLPDQWARRFDAGESIAAMLAKEAEKVMSPTTYEGNYRAPLGTFLTSAAQNFGDDGLRGVRAQVMAAWQKSVPGEPQATAPALLALVDAEHPPLRAFFGAGLLDMMRAEYAQRLDNWAEWSAVADAAMGSGGR